MEQLDSVVVGAGVIGLAVARSLALSGRDVTVLEAEPAIGTQTSSRNSEVIHAGIYYTPGSLKARTCVAGKEALYAYCESNGVTHKRTGKLIIATDDDQIETLRSLKANAEKNGVDDLRFLTAGECSRLEPAVSSVAGLLSPSSGIVDSHGFMLSLQADIEAAGSMVVCNTRVASVEPGPTGIEFEADGCRYSCRAFVNAAGLDAPALSLSTGSQFRHLVEQPEYAKGNYFSYSGGSPFTRLVYPVPRRHGLGIHATIDLSGRTRFGPDVEWVSTRDLTVNARRRGEFANAIRRYFPGIQEDRLLPDYAGLRPKIVRAGEAPRDFLIEDKKTHGVPNFINLLGIESPGLTASLAIGTYVASLIDHTS